MGVALFIAAMLGIIFLPDYPDFDDETIADEESDQNGFPENDPVVMGFEEFNVANVSEPDPETQSDAEAYPNTEHLAGWLENPPVASYDTIGQESGQVSKNTQMVGFDDNGDISVAHVSGFVVGEDVLSIAMNPNSVNGTLEVSVYPSETGTDSMIYVEQELIAVLHQTSDVTAQDVMVSLLTLST